MSGRRSERSELESILRGRRAEAPADLVESIARNVLAHPPSRRRQWSRLAFAAAVSVFILGSFASFGGLSYAASGADQAVSAVKQVVVKHKLTVSVRKTSASSQYPPHPAHHPQPPHHAHHAFTPPSALGATAKVSGKALPFTGVSLLATFAVSIFLIGLGLALRLRERRN